jgi:hypothetical protein
MLVPDELSLMSHVPAPATLTGAIVLAFHWTPFAHFNAARIKNLLRLISSSKAAVLISFNCSFPIRTLMTILGVDIFDFMVAYYSQFESMSRGNSNEQIHPL